MVPLYWPVWMDWLIRFSMRLESAKICYDDDWLIVDIGSKYLWKWIFCYGSGFDNKMIMNPFRGQTFLLKSTFSRNIANTFKFLFQRILAALQILVLVFRMQSCIIIIVYIRICKTMMFNLNFSLSR